MTEQLKRHLQRSSAARAQVAQAEDPRGDEAAVDEEAAGLVNEDEIKAAAIQNAEQNGIVFIDEIDKVTSRSEGSGRRRVAPGVQRDLLPLVEGTTVSTKYGPIKTDHILFIASGAFHLSKPSDLIPNCRDGLDPRGAVVAVGAGFRGDPDDDPRIAGQAVPGLAGHRGRAAGFTPEGITRLAQIAYDVNERTENTGARRLSTVMDGCSTR